MNQITNFCTECGAELPEGMKFCANCGKPVSAPHTPETPANQTVPPPPPPVVTATAPPPPPVVTATPPPPPPPPPPAVNKPVVNEPPVVKPSVSEPVKPTIAEPAEPKEQMPPRGSRYRPIGTWGFIGTFILLSIPIIGLIMCFVWAFSGSANLNRRNMSRAMLFFMILSVILAIVLFIFGATLTQQFSPYLDKLPWTSAQTETTETVSDDENYGIFSSFSDILSGLSGIVSSAGSDGLSGDLVTDESVTDESEADTQTASADGLAWIDGNFKVTYEVDEGAGMSAFMNTGDQMRLNITLVKVGDVLFEDRTNAVGQALYLYRVEDGKVASYIFNTNKKIAMRKETSHSNLAESARSHLAGICKAVQKRNKYEKIGEEEVAGLRCTVLRLEQKAEDNEYAKLAQALGGEKAAGLTKQLSAFSGTATIYESMDYPGTILRHTVQIGSKSASDILKVSYFRPSAALSDIPYDIDMSHYSLQ
ncbi:MAG: zinc ribbon domain-containing protein [Tannerella sp.]|nr:zinc ribbon domain-containing protein [Tannerella sp.]